MLFKILRVFIIAVGFFIGPGIVLAIQTAYERITQTQLFVFEASWILAIIYLASCAVSGIVFLVLSKRIAQAMAERIMKLEQLLTNRQSGSLLGGAIGLVIGLVAAALVSVIIGQIPIAWISVPLTIIEYIIFGYLGVTIGSKRKFELPGQAHGKKQAKRDAKTKDAIPPKILDTSVIIDGRIFDICKTGILEGEILIPEFVLEELQHIADSADSIKRTRGRRGLDILNKMQKELSLPVRVTDDDFDDVAEVDIKLIKLAKELGGKVVTNDYNLNKVAQVQDVPVFNMNELANALKPVLIAGEEMVVTIVKKGKEPNQGIAYLDDGTMIVVEDGQNKEGKAVSVVVTSVLQTAAGRMIFTKVK